MYILSFHNGINFMLPADDWLDWKNLFICNITNAMVQHLARNSLFLY